MKLNPFYYILILSTIVSSALYGKTPVAGMTYSLSDKVQTIPVGNVMCDPAWNIWCGSMVKGDDGKFHLFYSRWPRETRHEGWISHSEVAYAVADKPNGPYRHVNVALGATNANDWDGATAHNPYIIKHQGKYYLYYVGTHAAPLSASETIKAYGPEWWVRRNTQRIGVAVSDRPQGPWKRLPEPVLSASADSSAFDAMCVANPAICIGRSGKVVMLYKAVCKDGSERGGNVRFSVAFADSPTGPFVKSNKLIFQPEDITAKMVAEDPFVWYDNKTDKYYAVVRDVVREFTGQDSGGLALMESDDAIDWKVTPHPKVIPAILNWSDGSKYEASKNSVERPFIYFDKRGQPELLFGTFGINIDGIRRHHSFNGFIPFKVK